MPERFTPKSGTRILYPLYDGNGVLLLRAGAEITDRFRDVLARRGIHFQLKVELEVVQGGRVGARIVMPRESLVIGRSPKCHVRPNDPWISQRHCRIRKFAGRAVLADLGSTNGTFLNGSRVTRAVELSDGDQLGVGRFVFHVDLFADVAAESEDDQRAIDSLVLDDALRAPQLGPTLFAREHRAGSVIPLDA